MKVFVKKFLPIFIIIPAILVIAWYFFQLRHDIILAYEGKPTAFLNLLINNFYPRFSAEKERLELTFFLQKADQVIFRLGIISCLFALFTYLSSNVSYFKSRLHDFTFTETTPSNIFFLRIVYYLFLLLIIRELYIHLTDLYPAREFYKPVLLLKIFNIPFPNQFAIILICLLATLLSILVIFDIKTILSSSIALILLVLLQSWYSSFEKIDHGFVTFNYALMVFPFLLLEVKNSTYDFKSWSLRLIQILIAFVYFISGIEKILISGSSWLEPENLRAYIYLHQAPLGMFLSKSDALCILFSFFTLMLQLCFPLVLFFKKYKWIILSGGIIFHLGTLYILGIGHIFNPWVITYIFFIDWTKTGLKLENYLKNFSLLSR